MDVCKIAPALYQYTAIDDCSRYKVLGIYPRRTASNTLDFLEQVLEESLSPYSGSGDGPWPLVLGLQGPATPPWNGRSSSVRSSLGHPI